VKARTLDHVTAILPTLEVCPEDSVASHSGEVTYESDCDEMALWCLETEWSEGQTF